MTINLKLYITLCCLFSFIFISNAQKLKYYDEGYVITLVDDTLHGFIMKTSEDVGALRVTFVNPEGMKETFTTEDLVGYKKGETVYQKRKANHIRGFKRQQAFMKEVVRGEITLFTYHYYVGSNSIMSEAGILSGADSFRKEYYIETSDGVLHLINRLGFRRKLDALLGDSPLMSQVWAKELRYKHLPAIIKTYNDTL